MDAANRGDGDTMNALFGPEPSFVMANLPDVDPAESVAIGEAASLPTATALSPGDLDADTPSAAQPVECVRITVDLTAGSNSYFGLETPGRQEISFLLGRYGEDRGWYVIRLETS